MNSQRCRLVAALLFSLILASPSVGQAASEGENRAEIAERWRAKAFSRSTLSPEEQRLELDWFIQAAAPYRGMTIRVISEDIATHWYESWVLARAFTEITGIHVIHEVTAEDDLVRKLQAQMDTGLNIYDAYINDSDFIGTHYRRGLTIPISDYMENQWADITLPTLDLDDFIGLSFVTAPDGKVYQLPAQQFANLYWYRHDWFQREDLRQQFLQRYGYPLGVPQNWTAYEDIAEFFSIHVREIDGVRVYGHMDYGGTDPSLGWRMSDAWLSIAGAGDRGLPNGLPVDDWGIRVEGCHPVGASISRGGAVDGPAAIYALEKYLDWLNRFAPSEAKNMTFTTSGEYIANGQIAQQIFWYTAFMPALVGEQSKVKDAQGNPLWRLAPTPKGAYWQEGMKLGYQDAGSWTFLYSTPPDRAAAAWLYAQFTVARTVSMDKLLEGLTPIRASDINADLLTEKAPQLGGFVEFYRSSGRDIWTPTGTNVPDYALLSPLWWQHIGPAVRGVVTPREAMQSLAKAMDETLDLIAQQPDRHCQPRLNAPQSEEYWLQLPGAPKPALNFLPGGFTLPYEEAIKQWHIDG